MGWDDDPGGLDDLWVPRDEHGDPCPTWPDDEEPILRRQRSIRRAHARRRCWRRPS
jgi:hypothetical protein